MNFIRRALASFRRWRELRALRAHQLKTIVAQAQADAIRSTAMVRSGWAGEWRRMAALEEFEHAEAKAMRVGPPMRFAEGGKEKSLKEASFMDPFLSQDVNFALEQTQWARLTNFAKLEYSRWGLTRIILLCRFYFMSDPLIRRGINLSCSYVFGRGVQIHSDDKATNAAIEEFIKANPDTMSLIGLTKSERRIQYDGNLFFAFFWDDNAKQVKLRKIDPLEISDIITNPEDVSEPWFYKRIWSSEVVDAQGNVSTKSDICWYPAVGKQKDDTLTIASYPVMWETPVLHVKEGEIDGWKFGVPPVYPAVPWARLYKEFLENWASIVRAFQAISWTFTTEGGQSAVKNLDTAMSTTIGQGGFQPEYNPPPVTGSILTTGKGTEAKPMKTAGYATSLEEGQRLGLQVGVALDLPETILFGRADVGNLATSQTLDRPTELKFKGRQEMWRETIRVIITVALNRASEAPLSRVSREQTEYQITVEFPSILEHDPVQMVNAIATATTMNGYSFAGTIDPRTAARLFLNELGVADPEDILELMFGEDYDPKAFMPQPGSAEPAQDPQKAMDQAIERLKRAGQLFEALAKKRAA